MPLALTFNNLTFEGAGRYEWVIRVDNEPLGGVPLEVVQGTLGGFPLFSGMPNQPEVPPAT